MSEHVNEGLTFLLPVFNQAGVLEPALSSWSTLLERLERPYEILLIDDGSTDATKKLAEAMPHRVPHLRVLSHPERRGYGACLREGIAEAKQPLVFYTGCDHAYNPADLRTLLQRINDGDPETGKKIDVVNGYRAGTSLAGWVKWRERLWRIFLRVTLGLDVPPKAGWLGAEAHRYSRLLRAVFGLRIVDVNSRFKLLRKRIFERIPIQSDGDFVHAEILAKANFLGCLMDEVPIAQRPGPFAAHPEPPAPAPLGQELRRVFANPDFGPAILPSAQPAAEPAPASA